jgi:beta-glucosidase
VEYFDDAAMSGDPIAVHHGDDFRLQYLGAPDEAVPYPAFAARASATFHASARGKHEFVLRSNAPARLIVDDAVVDDLGERADVDWTGDTQELTWSIDLDADQRLPIAVEFVKPAFDTYSRTTLGCRRPASPDAHERAVRAARHADAVVLIVGHSDAIESEGFDRAALALPEGQDDLIRDVLTANPDTVVVVNAGGPVAMPWLDDVPAIVQAWFGGQELGFALADVLDGTADPGGRMPFTVPLRIEDTPTYGSFPGEFGAVRYTDGLLVGHRWYDTRDLPVAVPFGYGGSYTTFEWHDAGLVRTVLDPGNGTTVRVTVENTGDRAGSDVVQVYVRPPADLQVFRPRRELKGFAKVQLSPGERRVVEIDLTARSFAHWVPEDTSIPYHDRVRATPFASTVPHRAGGPGWTVAPGEYAIEIARSIADVFAVLPLHVRA